MCDVLISNDFCSVNKRILVSWRPYHDGCLVVTGIGSKLFRVWFAITSYFSYDCWKNGARSVGLIFVAVQKRSRKWSFLKKASSVSITKSLFWKKLFRFCRVSWKMKIKIKMCWHRSKRPPVERPKPLRRCSESRSTLQSLCPERVSFGLFLRPPGKMKHFGRSSSILSRPWLVGARFQFDLDEVVKWRWRCQSSTRCSHLASAIARN